MMMLIVTVSFFRPTASESALDIPIEQARLSFEKDSFGVRLHSSTLLLLEIAIQSSVLLELLSFSHQLRVESGASS